MKSILVYYLIAVSFVTVGCAASRTSPLVIAPGPPVEWSVIKRANVGCPDVTGEYVLTPMVATMKKHGVWQISTGNWFDYALLLPFDRAGVEKQRLNEKSGVYSRSSLVFESTALETVIEIVSPVNNADDFVAHVIRKSRNDYLCEAGSLVFPGFKITGGTEGSVLSGRIYRSATITLTGDLLFYEQVQGHETTHKYYLFKRI